MPGNQLVLYKKESRSTEHGGPRIPDEPSPEASIPSSGNTASPSEPYDMYLRKRSPHIPLLLLSSVTSLWLLAFVAAYNKIIAIAGALTISSLVLALKFLLLHIKAEQAARVTAEWESKLGEEKKKWEQAAKDTAAWRFRLTREVQDAEREALAKREREFHKRAVQQKESELDALEQRWHIIAEYEKKMAEQQGREQCAQKSKRQEIEAEMRKRLTAYGFDRHEVEAILHPKTPGPTPVRVTSADAPTPPRWSPVPVSNPPSILEPPPVLEGREPFPPPPTPPPQHHNWQHTYTKVRHEHLSLRTLDHYRIPWEPDKVDPNCIIIPRELSPEELVSLFKHTRKLRSSPGPLMFEEDHF